MCSSWKKSTTLTRSPLCVQGDIFCCNNRQKIHLVHASGRAQQPMAELCTPQQVNPLLPIPIPPLPFELLLMIFDWVPPRPRLRVVSLVCKRWRMAVLHSITSLHSPQRASNAIKLCSSLTHLELDLAREPLPELPTSLRSLSLPFRRTSGMPSDQLLKAYWQLSKKHDVRAHALERASPRV